MPNGGQSGRATAATRKLRGGSRVPTFRTGWSVTLISRRSGSRSTKQLRVRYRNARNMLKLNLMLDGRW